jgi:hypothetical protein
MPYYAETGCSSAVLLQWVSRTKLIGTGMANCHVTVVHIYTSFLVFLLWQVTLVDKVEISLFVCVLCYTFKTLA